MHYPSENRAYSWNVARNLYFKLPNLSVHGKRLQHSLAVFGSTGVSCPELHASHLPQLGAADSQWEASWPRRARRQLWNSVAHIMVSVFCLKVYEGYGQTECTAGCTFTTPGDWTSGRAVCVKRRGVGGVVGGGQSVVHSISRLQPTNSLLEIKFAQELREKSKRNRKNKLTVVRSGLWYCGSDFFVANFCTFLFIFSAL